MNRRSDAHWAIVTQAAPLFVRPQGSTTAVAALHLPAYAPVVDDRVAYVLLDVSERGSATLLVLGKPV